jgi:hypothetical protein
VLDLLEQGGQADLLEAVQMVAAGRAIGAHAHGDSMAAEGQEIGDAGAELQVGAGAVNDARAVVPHSGEIPVGDPDAVGEAQVGREHALVVEVVNFVPPSLKAPDDRGLVLLLQGVGVDRPALAERQVAEPGPERIGVGEDEVRVQGVAQAPLPAPS